MPFKNPLPYDKTFKKTLPVKRNPARTGGILSFRVKLNENRIQRPILGTSEQDIEHLQTLERVYMLQ